MVQALSVSCTSTGSRRSELSCEASTRLAPWETSRMREGRSGGSAAGKAATRGSERGSWCSPGKRESCRMATRHSSRPAPALFKADRAQDSSDPKLTLRIGVCIVRRKLRRCGERKKISREEEADGGEERLKEGQQEGRAEVHQAQDQEEVARTDPGGLSTARPPAGPEGALRSATLHRQRRSQAAARRGAGARRRAAAEALASLGAGVRAAAPAAGSKRARDPGCAAAAGRDRARTAHGTGGRADLAGHAAQRAFAGAPHRRVADGGFPS